MPESSEHNEEYEVLGQQITEFIGHMDEMTKLPGSEINAAATAARTQAVVLQKEFRGMLPENVTAQLLAIQSAISEEAKNEIQILAEKQLEYNESSDKWKSLEDQMQLIHREMRLVPGFKM